MPLADLPQSNKQHAVPQNIMEVEFKLIGDLTMRQFAYLMLFGGMAYLASISVIGVFKWPLVAINAILGFGLAFVPIQERGLDEWIVNFIRAIYSPTQRVWRKEPTIPSAFVYENINVVKQEMIALAPTSSRRKLEEYLHYKFDDTEFDPLDINEAEYVNKVRAAYANDVPQMPSAPSAPVGVDVLEPELPIYVPGESDQQPEAVPEIPQQAPEISPESPSTEPSFTPPSPEKATETPTPVSTQAPAPAQVSTPVASAPYTPPVMPTNTVASTPIIKQRKQPVPSIPQDYDRVPVQSQFNATPITPDMHAGRRFTNLLPYGGEIVLPIRGEKVIKTSEESDIEQDISDKAEKLQKLLAQIKNSSGVSRQAPTPAPTPEPVPAPIVNENVSNEAENLAAKLKLENDTLTEQIDQLKAETGSGNLQGAAIADKETRIRELEMQKERTQDAYVKLEQQVLDLQNKLQEKQKNEGIPLTNSPVQPIYAKIQPLTTAPNVVTGIVKKADGTVAEGLVLMIKGSKGDIVRAFKTNSLGQFSLITPLNSGIYTLEVSKDEKSTGMSFDIISVEAKGEVIPPLEIIGKPLQ